MNLAILPSPEPNTKAILLFRERLGVDEAIATKLAKEYSTLEELVLTTIPELLATGIDESCIKRIQAKAANALNSPT